MGTIGSVYTPIDNGPSSYDFQTGTIAGFLKLIIFMTAGKQDHKTPSPSILVTLHNLYGRFSGSRSNVQKLLIKCCISWPLDHVVGKRSVWYKFHNLTCNYLPNWLLWVKVKFLIKYLTPAIVDLINNIFLIHIINISASAATYNWVTKRSTQIVDTPVVHSLLSISRTSQSR